MGTVGKLDQAYRTSVDTSLTTTVWSETSTGTLWRIVLRPSIDALAMVYQRPYVICVYRIMLYAAGLFAAVLGSPVVTPASSFESLTASLFPRGSIQTRAHLKGWPWLIELPEGFWLDWDTSFSPCGPRLWGWSTWAAGLAARRAWLCGVPCARGELQVPRGALEVPRGALPLPLGACSDGTERDELRPISIKILNSHWLPSAGCLKESIMMVKFDPDQVKSRSKVNVWHRYYVGRKFKTKRKDMKVWLQAHVV